MKNNLTRHPGESRDFLKLARKIPAFAGMTLALISLASCVSRDQADAKLSRGCAAGVEAFLDAGHHIASITQSTFADSADLGKGYRVVNLKYVDNDGFANSDLEASCVFAEQFGFMNMGFAAQIYQLKMGDKIVGKEGSQIQGSYEENLKLNERVDEAMNGAASAGAPPADGDPAAAVQDDSSAPSQPSAQ